MNGRTIIRSGPEGSVIRWEAMTNYDPLPAYYARRTRDRGRLITPLLKEAIAFITDDRVCPVLDLYGDKPYAP